MQIKDKRESLLLLQQAHSEPSRWKTNRQKMSGMHHDLSAPPWGEGSLNPHCCWRARLHSANSQRKRCRLSQAFRRTGPAPPLQFVLLCTPVEYGEGGINLSWPSLWCCFHHIVFFSLCSGQQRVSSSVRVLPSFSPACCSTWTCVAWNKKDRGMQREGRSGLHLNPLEA